MKAVIVSVIAMLITGSPVLCQAEDETEIPLEQVPPAVLDSVRTTYPGISLVEAEIITDDSGTGYEIEGILDRREIEIRLTDKGQIISVEEDD